MREELLKLADKFDAEARADHAGYGPMIDDPDTNVARAAHALCQQAYAKQDCAERLRKLADGRGEGVQATDGLGGEYSIEYTGPHTIQLTPISPEPPTAAEPAKHWHDLYRKECRLRQDDAARYGQQIIDLEGELTRRAGEGWATTDAGREDADERFFIEHGVVHDRKTGRHVTDYSPEELLDTLHRLQIDARAWRMTAHAFEVGSRLTPAGGEDGRDGIALIVAERRRQIDSEGWTPEHDDEHGNNSLAFAAAAYAIPESHRGDPAYPRFWPWELRWWKPSPNDRIRELTKAGALIAAEIDRMQRASAERGAGSS